MDWYSSRTIRALWLEARQKGTQRGGPGLISQIDTKAKCRHVTKLTVRRLCGRSLPVWGPSPPMAQYPPPLLHTVHTCVLVGYLFTQGRKEGRRDGQERRLEGQQFTKQGRKCQHDWLYLQSKNSGKHLPQSPLTGQFLKMTIFCFGGNLVTVNSQRVALTRQYIN